MYNTIIITALAAMEAAFLVWNLSAKTTHKKAKAYVRLGLAAVIAVLLLTGVFQGIVRYAGIILLLAVMGLAGLGSFKRRGDKQPKAFGSVMKVIGCGVLYLTAMLFAIMFPQYKPVGVTGDLTVETAKYTWTDESRTETYSDSGECRSLTVQMYYPGEEGSYPLVVYSHGACGTADANDSAFRELASNGYVVCSIGHPYHAMYVTDTEGKTTIIDNDFMAVATGSKPLTTEEEYEYYKQWMSVREGDMNFVLDTVIDKANNGGECPFDRIDTDRIGLFGHSLGGATSEIVGRTRDDVDAVIVLEGTMLGEFTGIESDDFLSYDDIEYPVPLMDVNSRLVYEQQAAGNAPENAPEGYEYVNFYIVEHAKDAREVVFNDAAHMNFCDLPLVSPPLASMFGTGDVDARECITNVNHIVLEFFDYYLKDSGSIDIASEY